MCGCDECVSASHRTIVMSDDVLAVIPSCIKRSTRRNLVIQCSDDVLAVIPSSDRDATQPRHTVLSGQSLCTGKERFCDTNLVSCELTACVRRKFKITLQPTKHCALSAGRHV